MLQRVRQKREGSRDLTPVCEVHLDTPRPECGSRTRLTYAQIPASPYQSPAGAFTNVTTALRTRLSIPILPSLTTQPRTNTTGPRSRPGPPTIPIRGIIPLI